MGERLFAEIDNDLAEIGRVTALIECFGAEHKLPQAVVFHLVLAFDEVLTNIISHGFCDGNRHKITASISFEGNTLAAEIIDDGIAFDPFALPPPDTTLSIEEREIGGLGIHFVRTAMDAVDYHRIDGRNHLKLIKIVPAEPAN